MLIIPNYYTFSLEIRSQISCVTLNEKSLVGSTNLIHTIGLVNASNVFGRLTKLVEHATNQIVYATNISSLLYEFL